MEQDGVAAEPQYCVFLSTSRRLMRHYLKAVIAISSKSATAFTSV
jgi:hypothetical protein